VLTDDDLELFGGAGVPIDIDAGTAR